jgi:hypothetical protein
MTNQESPKKLEIKLSKVYKSTKANEVKLKTYLKNVKKSDNRNV